VIRLYQWLSVLNEQLVIGYDDVSDQLIQIELNHDLAQEFKPTVTALAQQIWLRPDPVIAVQFPAALSDVKSGLSILHQFR
jgi:hypothetical protein